MVFDSCQLIRQVGHSVFSRDATGATGFNPREISNLIDAAKEYKGVVYKSGGVDTTGMDCSGLLYRVYVDQNYLIPRVSSQQAMFGLPVGTDAIKEGDWIFFKTNGSSNINHVGLVTKVISSKEVLFLHASTSKGVREDNLFSKYWFSVFVKAVRPFKNISK